MININEIVSDKINDFYNETGFKPDVLILSVSARDHLIHQISDFYREERNKLEPETFMGLIVCVQYYIPGLLIDVASTKKQIIKEDA
jgi:hypothetical protein